MVDGRDLTPKQPKQSERGLVGVAEMLNEWFKSKGLYLNGDREVRIEKSLALWPVDNSDRKSHKTNTL